MLVVHSLSGNLTQIEMSSVRVSLSPAAKHPLTAAVDVAKQRPPGQGRIAVSTMGCKVNTFESELIVQKLAPSYERVAEVEQADVYLINTCTVTVEADRQARQQVRKAIRANPNAWVIVTGCYAQINPEACSEIPGVDLVVGNSKKLDIPSLLEPLYKGELPPVMVGDLDSEISLPDQLVSGFDGRSRAFVQIQQGCDQGCTFCIIHTARGPNRSFEPTLIRRQAERLVMNGYREIVICGVDIGSYGSDFDSDFDLVDLLKGLVEIDGDFRLRLSSIDPVHLTDRLAALMAESDKLCPQLHLSLQSADTLILKRMKRRATRDLLYDRVSVFRQRVPDLVLSADILVGFPTESEAHFAATLDAVTDLSIPFPHVFPYSPRQGTPAARIPRQVPKAVRKSRAALVREAGQREWQRVASRLIGSRQRLLVEGSESDDQECLMGRAANYFRVEFRAGETVQGDWQDVEIIDVGDNCLIARRVG